MKSFRARRAAAAVLCGGRRRSHSDGQKGQNERNRPLGRALCAAGASDQVTAQRAFRFVCRVMNAQRGPTPYLGGGPLYVGSVSWLGVLDTDGFFEVVAGPLSLGGGGRLLEEDGVGQAFGVVGGRALSVGAVAGRDGLVDGLAGLFEDLGDGAGCCGHDSAFR